MRIFLIFASMVCIAVSPLSAGPLPGDDDVVYQKAYELWMSDDEENSIPMFSALAKDGNSAARFLLTQIDKSPQYWGPWVTELTRNQRVKLFRVPGGLSGKSWINSIADIPLAKAWLEARSVDLTIETVMDFVDLGEQRAAHVALFFLDGRQGNNIAELADDPRYPPSLRYLIWQEWRQKDEQAERISREIDALDSGDPQRTMMGQQVSELASESWLSHSPLTEPLRVFCQSQCPGSVSSCTRAARFTSLPKLPALA